MTVPRSLRSALPMCTALLLAGSPAWAVSDLSEDICSDPTGAAERIMEHFDNPGDSIDTDGFGDKGCSKLCKEMEKLCDKTAKADEKCIKNGDSFTHKLNKALCEDSECKDAVKAQQQADKDELKGLGEQSDANCAELGNQCLIACDAGDVFPFEL